MDDYQTPITTDAVEEAALRIDERQLTRQALWERKLLDFSLRNNLLNTRLGKRALQLVSFNVNHLEDLLQSGANYAVQPWPEGRKKLEAEDGIFHSTTQAAPIEEQATADIQTHNLRTYLTAVELKPVLTNLYRGARTALEENGANSLFIAIGFLKWFVTDRSGQPRYAPILLLPVNMVRNAGSYVVRLRDEEPILNVTLMEFLRQQFKLQVPAMNPLPKDESGVDVPKVLDFLRAAISHQPRWDILQESMLGLFSFNKFVMWNDIHANMSMLQTSPIVQSLVERRLTIPAPEQQVDVHAFDLSASPAEVATPISVDSSQLEAVIESGNGQSFILYGPPGTGKSQTITNMIANALYKGKRVLFVAEKMAALSVVEKRLAKIGLAPFCLELHSNKVTKQHFLQQLQEALDVTHGHLSENFSQRSEELFALRRQLNRHIQVMHSPSEFGPSLYDCIERYLSIIAKLTAQDCLSGHFPTVESPAPDHQDNAPGAALPHIPLTPDFVRRHHADELEALTNELTQLDALFRLTGHPAGHPLTGLVVDDDHREALERLEHLFRSFVEADADEPAALVASWERVQSQWFLPRFFARRRFLKRLRRYHSSLSTDDIPAFTSQLAVMGDKAAMSVWLEHKAEWKEWAQWSQRRQSLLARGLQPVVNYIEAGHSGSETAMALARELYREWALLTIDGDEQLRRFSGLVFEEVIDRYRQLTEHFQELTKKELYCRLAARIPNISIEAATGSEVNILKRNIANGGRGTSIRHIIDQIPNLLPKLCPCMLMSPISVAQFIDLKQPKFDIVIFDEASQMPTAEAIGAIGRGNALVVVGDNKQMPPTSFFSTQQVDDEDAELDDLDSILDDCQALSVPSHYLAFHYRSKHESLIAFSNQEYYENHLFTFPSADDRLSKVSLVKVEGTYDKGGRRSNRAEAEAVVAEILRRLADEALSGHSIGVVAFSVAQQNLIEDVLMEALADKPELEQRAFAAEEPIFIKNLENVQGDERDVILFSIGYGPDKDGNVSMNFGPLNNRGGERRLNVAVSRARYEMVVFSTLRPEQIDLKRSNAAGVEGLKKFLKYAETGDLSSADGTTQSHDIESPDAVAGAIAAQLRTLGYEATTGVGRSKFKVDVAIGDPKDPERYILGLLIDGHTRLTAKIARDRELTQPDVLQGLGWRVMRVWGIDWLQHPKRVMAAILQAIEGGEHQQPREPLHLTTPRIVQENSTAAPSKPRTVQGDSRTAHPGPRTSHGDAVAVSPPPPKPDISAVPEKTIDAAILQVVNSQVALPFDDLLRAATRQLGYARRTKRIDNILTRRIGALIVANQILRDGEHIKSL